LANRETKLEEEKEKAEKALNAKYEQLALQFSSYGAVINQMESSFSGLKML
jgi:flagellar hook-associated protein 2